MSSAPVLTMTLSAEEARRYVGQRLDVAVATVLGRSRNHAQSLLREGCVGLYPRTGKAEASYRLRVGDWLTIRASAPAAEVRGNPVWSCTRRPAIGRARSSTPWCITGRDNWPGAAGASGSASCTGSIRIQAG
jgi:hypothetical protein